MSILEQAKVDKAIEDSKPKNKTPKTLFEQIKADRLDARKRKNQQKSTLLSTLLGEIENEAKGKGTEITDDLVVAKCKKFIKNMDLAGEHCDSETFATIEQEKYILKLYLPRQMDRAQLKSMISGLGAENIGQYMKVMNSIYKGQFDNRLAMEVAKEYFNGK